MGIVLVLSILIGLCAVSYAANDGDFVAVGEATDTHSLDKRGWVDRRYCRAPRCAALGDPYRYNVYSASSIKEAALAAIQEIGFSFNPTLKGPSIAECTLLHQQHANSDETTFSLFWTDFVVLTDHFMGTLKVTWKEIGITPSDDIIYRLRVMGCHHTAANGVEVPFLNPKAARLPESYDDETYRTSVKLIMAAVMEKRALKSAFVPTRETVQPKPILDRIKQLIDLKSKEVKVMQFNSDSQGRVWN